MSARVILGSLVLLLLAVRGVESDAYRFVAAVCKLGHEDDDTNLNVHSPSFLFSTYPRTYYCFLADGTLRVLIENDHDPDFNEESVNVVGSTSIQTYVHPSHRHCNHHVIIRKRFAKRVYVVFF